MAGIAEATGRDVRHIPVEIDDYLAALRGHGVPPVDVALIEILAPGVSTGATRTCRTAWSGRRGICPARGGDGVWDA